MKDKKIVVLLGGTSNEREVSLKTGKAILDSLQRQDLQACAFDWNAQRISEFIAEKFETAFIALHGGSGENGEIQAFLEMLGVNYTGSGVLASSLCMDKIRSKRFIQDIVDVPAYFTLNRLEAQALLENKDTSKYDTLLQKIALPLVVKPSCDGSSVGISLVREQNKLDEALQAALNGKGDIILEQYIKGHELTVAVLAGKALGVCEIVPKNDFYDYEAKYFRNDTQYLLPTTMGEEFERNLCKLAEKIYAAFGCAGVARVDFLTNNQNIPYFLEVNTVPGMTEKSLVPKIAAYNGMTFDELTHKILTQA